MPQSVLYDAQGTVDMPLEKVDMGPLTAAGYKFPEPFTVKADDGITDIYGVMYKPFDFDPNRKYPDHRIRLSGPADRERDPDVLAAPGQCGAGQPGLHRR